MESYMLEDFVKHCLREENIEYVKYLSPNRFTTVFRIQNWENEIILSSNHFEVWRGVYIVNSIHYGSMEDIFAAMSMILFFINK